MTRHAACRGIFFLTLATILNTSTAATAGDFFSESNFGSSFFNSSPACPAKRIPTLESLVPIPSIVDPFAQDFVPIFCQVQARAGSDGVKGVKGNYTSELVVRDNNTGQLESFPSGSGSFRTNKRGQAEFEFEIPAELFADGFESGDVSAWSYTRTDFSNKKQVDNTAVQCGKSASRSD